MQPYKKIFLILTIHSLVLMESSFSCKKNVSFDNPYGLPNATQKGANIFACRVNNDSNWIAKPTTFSLGTSLHSSNKRDTISWYGIVGLNWNGTAPNSATEISFTINSTIDEGATYRLNDTDKAFVRTTLYNGIWKYATDGYVTITKYSGTYFIPSPYQYGAYDANSIISGTFNFVVAMPNRDTIKITDGRFDINYSQF